MRKLGAMAVMGATVGALLCARTASAAPAADGVFFVHGTGDFTAPSTSLNPTNGTAITSYWTQSSINSMIADPAGGNWAYGVAGYPGASQNAQTAYATVATQLLGFWRADAPMMNVVVVTHSNGSNPIRYLLAHPTAIVTDPLHGNVCAGYIVGGTCTTGYYTGALAGFVKKVVFIAGDNAGTPLADKVTQAGTLANIANNIVSDILGPNSSYNTPSVVQQVQANMASYNSNGTFATGATPNGMATNIVYGSGVNAGLFSSEAWCGGYLDSVGLKATQVYGWGSSSAATDGFIGTNSSTYVGTDPNGYGGDSKLNHNQSRRSCDGSNSKITAYVHSTLNGAFTAPPPDYVEPPAVQACDLATPEYIKGTDNGGTYYVWGCTSAMHADTNIDDDCEAIYGTDDWSASQNNYTVTIPFDYAETGYSNPIYYYPYTQSSGGCSDSWLGDGQCDLCLLAKYGYDSASGTVGDDDCYNQGSGTQTQCADILLSSSTNTNEYATITITH